MNKILVTIVGILIIGAAGWLVISSRTAPEESNGQAEFGRVPDFTLQDYEGKTVRVADFAGRPLVINSWASWCPFCVKELADFAALQNEFGEQIVVVAINRQESSAVAKTYTDRLGLSDELIFLVDPDDSFYRSIGGFSMPETVFTDESGRIAVHKRGPMELEEMREKVNSVLKN